MIWFGMRIAIIMIMMDNIPVIIQQAIMKTACVISHSPDSSEYRKVVLFHYHSTQAIYKFPGFKFQSRRGKLKGKMLQIRRKDSEFTSHFCQILEMCPFLRRC